MLDNLAIVLPKRCHGSTNRNPWNLGSVVKMPYHDKLFIWSVVNMNVPAADASWLQKFGKKAKWLIIGL
jgi:hypothetical protein